MGNVARKRLGEGFVCETTGVILTRGKIRGSPRNIIKEGRVASSEIFAEDENCYEVVYQCRTANRKCTISLFEDQLNDLAFRNFTVKKYGSVWHLFHRYGLMLSARKAVGRALDVGSSMEVYPQKYVVSGVEKTYDGHYGKRADEL